MPPFRTLGLALAALSLAACANTAQETAEMADAKAEAAGDTACGADARQEWVGQNVTVLNTAELPETARVMFPGAAATMDFRPDRLNITIGTDDSITRVYCG